MEVILSQDVSSLGNIGDVVQVKDGYARNYLIPNKLAFIATATNLRRIELQKKKQMEAAEKAKQEAMELSEKLKKVSCTINVEVNDLDKLYGSVTEMDIAKALEVEGFEIEKKNILLENPIEELGIFDVDVRVHSELTTKIRVWVTKK
ncbi:MAG: 50S ribosomal protein L9 [Candidatus Omnitrophica bacterium]|nr:50S ribosomal protein L9 [Candidatus Omnitrophota bacterium]